MYVNADFYCHWWSLLIIPVPAGQPVISGPQPAITTALDAGSTYTYVCTAGSGRPAPNIVWKLGTSLASSVEFHQGITENTATNSDSTLNKTSSLSWVPIVADNGKSLYCQTDQTQAGGSVLTQSAAVAIVVQRKSNCITSWDRIIETWSREIIHIIFYV
jgi:hypothetical protein